MGTKAGIRSIQAPPHPSSPSRSRSKSLMRHDEDIRCVISTALFFAVFVITWQTFTSPFTGGLLPFVAWLALFQLSFMGAVTTHNAIHLPIFWHKEWNNFYQICLSLQYGGAVSIFIPGHNLSHHKYPQQARDVSKSFSVPSPVFPALPSRHICSENSGIEDSISTPSTWLILYTIK
jgi:fatty acid desaturase